MGRADALERIVYVSALPQDVIDSPVSGLRTTEEVVQVIGSADNNGYKFYLYDQPIMAVGRTFDVVTPLNQGANLLTVNAMTNKGLSASSYSFYRRTGVEGIVLSGYGATLLMNEVSILPIQGASVVSLW